MSEDIKKKREETPKVDPVQEQMMRRQSGPRPTAESELQKMQIQ